MYATYSIHPKFPYEEFLSLFNMAPAAINFSGAYPGMNRKACMIASVSSAVKSFLLFLPLYASTAPSIISLAVFSSALERIAANVVALSIIAFLLILFLLIPSPPILPFSFFSSFYILHIQRQNTWERRSYTSFVEPYPSFDEEKICFSLHPIPPPLRICSGWK